MQIADAATTLARMLQNTESSTLWLGSEELGDSAGTLAVDHEMYIARDAGHFAPRQVDISLIAVFEPELFLAGRIRDPR